MNDQIEPIEEKKEFKKAKASKKYISLVTAKVHCNKLFDLVEGEQIPKEISKPFIDSLITNKTIKEV